MLPQSDDRFDQDLARWFSSRGGAWSGTAAELLASVGTRSDVGSCLWPESPRGLYDHLKSHRLILRSFGLDVQLREGVPRMVSLRSCHNEQPPRQSLAETSAIGRSGNPPIKVSSVVDSPTAIPASSGDAGQTPSETFNADIPTTKSGLAVRSVAGIYADGDNSEGRIFENTGDALLAIVEMRRRIREQGLDFKSAVDLVISRAQEITRACGIAVGFLAQVKTGRPFRSGGASLTKGLHFVANVFQSSLMAGQAMQLQDAKEHPVLGAACRREHVGSLVIVPIFRNREVAGAMEFLFQERRSFSAGDVMDLGLIAGVISESVGDDTESEGNGAEGGAPPAMHKNVAQRPEYPTDARADAGNDLLNRFKQTTNAKTTVPSPAPASLLESAVAARMIPTTKEFWLAVKRAWMRHSRWM